MAFFSTEIADALQLVTFPLELIGILLATIEVRFPTIAYRIASTMDDYASRIRRIKEADEQDSEEATALWRAGERFEALRHYFRGARSEVPMQDFMQPISPAFKIIRRIFSWTFNVLSWGLAIALVIFIAEKIHVVDTNLGGVVSGLLSLSGAAATALFYLILLSILVFFGWILMSFASYISISFVEGRAVGTLGIIIAGIGLLGEGYQFATQLLV